MAVTVKNISEVFGKDVFTVKGAYCGKVADIKINLSKFRVNSLIIEASRGSFLADIVGGRKYVIVPYQIVESVGDVVIIKHIVPSVSESSESEIKTTETI